MATVTTHDVKTRFFFQNRPPFGQNRFLPVIEWLLSTDYRGTWAYAKERNVPGTPV